MSDTDEADFGNTPYSKYHFSYAETDTGTEGLLETYGEDLARVKSAPSNHVWTVVDGDEGSLYVIAGFHYVNRVAYFISEVPWESDDQCFLWWKGDDEDEDSDEEDDEDDE